MTEFEFIAKHLAELAGPQALDLKDDAAVWTPPAGFDLVLTKDAMVEGVHFPNGHYGADTAEKLLRVNLSDLAAKGATPFGYMLSLALPRNLEDKWLAAFALGLKDTQALYDFKLLGGDTTRIDGPMVVSCTMFGLVPSGEVVLRSGAKAGDGLFVTGTIGDAYLGLQIVLEEPVSPAPSGEALWAWEQAYYRPEPRLSFRKALRKYASAALDVSDGLIADAGHLASVSEVGLEIELRATPLSEETQAWLTKHPNRDDMLKALVTGGDDYEILFTVSEANIDEMKKAAKVLKLKITQIGNVTYGQGVTVRNEHGQRVSFDKTGYTHF